MLEPAPDVAPHIGRYDEDAGRPHQELGEVGGPARRVPDVDPAGRAIGREAVNNQYEANQRSKRKQALVRSLPEPRNHGRAQGASSHQDMHPEKHDQPGNQNRQAHLFQQSAGNPEHACAVEAMAGPEASRRTWRILGAYLAPTCAYLAPSMAL